MREFAEEIWFAENLPSDVTETLQHRPSVLKPMIAFILAVVFAWMLPGLPEMRGANAGAIALFGAGWAIAGAWMMTSLHVLRSARTARTADPPRQGVYQRGDLVALRGRYGVLVGPAADVERSDQAATLHGVTITSG